MPAPTKAPTVGDGIYDAPSVPPPVVGGGIYDAPKRRNKNI